MKTSSLLFCMGAAALVAGCGSRTSDEDLLSYTLNRGGGNVTTGGSGVGGSVGGTDGIPGFPSGGGPAGGTSTGGWSTGGVSAGGGAVGGAFTGGAGGDIGVCCEPTPFPGCESPGVEQCVCSADAFCCENSWDEQCVRIAQTRCFPACGAGGSGGDGTGGAGPTGGTGGVPDVGDCCEARPDEGCGDARLRACVCDQDPYCCETAWDQVCVNRAEECGGDCGAGGSGGMPSTGGSGGMPSTGGSGGMPSTGGQGGMPGTGGQGGGSGGDLGMVCGTIFQDECGACVCGSCIGQVEACGSQPHCAAISWCIIQSGCTDWLSCYAPDTCRDAIDASGGLLSSSTLAALSLGVCAIQSACDCP